MSDFWFCKRVSAVNSRVSCNDLATGSAQFGAGCPLPRAGRTHARIMARKATACSTRLARTRDRALALRQTRTPPRGTPALLAKRGLMKRRSLAAAIGIVVVTLICVCSLYAHFIQEKVYEESADHLKEIYTQVNNTFSMLVSDNWNHLTTWNMFFEDTAKHSPDGPSMAKRPTKLARLSAASRTSGASPTSTSLTAAGSTSRPAASAAR